MTASSSGHDSFWQDRPVLVTGAAGLLGGWVTRTLAAAGSQVIGIDIAWRNAWEPPSAAVTVVDGNVRDLPLLTELLGGPASVDAVIHLAAQPIVGDAQVDPVDTFANNIEGTWTVLEACRRASRVPAVLVASSDKAYGDAGASTYEESMPLRARHPYAASKACADLLAQTYAESYGLPTVISRCGNLYGGGDRNWSRIVPGTIRSILLGQAPVIRSDGSPVRDYLYVEDVAAGMLGLTRAILVQPDLRGEAFNFGGGERRSVADVVSRILRLMGSDLEPVIRNDAVNEIAEQRVGAAKAQRLLGWSPQHSLEAGLTRTVSWYAEHLALLA